MDHPRSRGVYNNPGTDLVPGLGSSPLARGLLDANSPLEDQNGIIPARAGFTRTRRS